MEYGVGMRPNLYALDRQVRSGSGTSSEGDRSARKKQHEWIATAARSGRLMKRSGHEFTDFLEAPPVSKTNSRSRGPGKPFRPGNRFGKGRPTGSRNTATLALQALLDRDGEAIMRKAIRLAKAGNETALRLCLERLIAPRKERPVRLKLPADISTAEGISHALAAILASAAQGEITIGEAVQLASLLEVRRKMIETQEFERRLGEMENRMNSGESESRKAR